MKKKACQREIACLKRLAHPGVIYLHDLIDSSKQIFMITDYIKGISLREYVK
jgi:serine/threonine protein kinase